MKSLVKPIIVAFSIFIFFFLPSVNAMIITDPIIVDHTQLVNIGTNDHDSIDTHLANDSTHYGENLFLFHNGSRPLTGNWDVNDYNITNLYAVSGGPATSDNIEIYANDNPFAQANTGRIKLHERMTFSDNYTATSVYQDAVLTFDSTITSAGGVIAPYGVWGKPTITYSAKMVLSSAPVMFAAPTYRMTTADTDTIALFSGFSSSPIWEIGYDSGAGVTNDLWGYGTHPIARRAPGNTGSGTVTEMGGFTTYPVTFGAESIEAGVTVIDFRHFRVGSLFGVGGTVTDQTGLYIPNLAGATNNYGIESIMTSGANKLFIRHTGTAKSQFGGVISILADNTPMMWGAGDDYHAEFDGSVFVFNQDSLNADFRIESDDQVNMFRLDASADRIGLSIADPSSDLEVRSVNSHGIVLSSATGGDKAIVNSLTDNDEMGFIKFDASGGSEGKFGFYSEDGDGTSDIEVRLYGKGVPSGAGNEEYLELGWNSVSNRYEILTATVGGTQRNLVISTSGNANQLTIEHTTGHIGINRGDPTAQLDVNGNVIIDGNTLLNGSVTIGTDTLGYDLKAYSATAGDYLEWDASNKQLNIIGTDDQVALIVTGETIITRTGAPVASGYTLSVQDDGTYTYIEILNGAGAGKGAFFGMGGSGVDGDPFELWNYQGGPINFYTHPTATGGTLRMTIAADGNVGINDASPDAQLDIAGDVIIEQTLSMGTGASQVGIIMTSPDASEWCVKVWDDGVLNATSGAC